MAQQRLTVSVEEYLLYVQLLSCHVCLNLPVFNFLLLLPLLPSISKPTPKIRLKSCH